MKRVIALGFFDGVHIGHAALLRQALKSAEAYTPPVQAVAMTFDTPPREIISGNILPLLTTTEQRSEIIRKQFGMDCIALPFTDNLMQMSYSDFVPQVLQTQYDAVGVVVGEDYRYGYGGEGNAEILRQQCIELGMSCDIVSRVRIDDEIVSATAIRALLARGETARANEFLGRAHTLCLPVCRGRGLGKQLGFPTANMLLPKNLQQPALGVYRAQVKHNDKIWAAVTNIGKRPTVSDDALEYSIGKSPEIAFAPSFAKDRRDAPIIIESHLIGYHGDLYDQILCVELLSFMRAERKFDSLDELKIQMAMDRSFVEGRADARGCR